MSTTFPSSKAERAIAGENDPTSTARRTGWLASRPLTTPEPSPGTGSVRALFVVVLVAAAAGGLVLTPPVASARAVAAAGEDLTRLLRGMAALKVSLALAAVLGVFWRLGARVSKARLAVYALACGAMALGPGLIWGMVYVRAGAALLHGGLLVSLVVLWRDPGATERLAEKIAQRRASLRASGAPFTGLPRAPRALRRLPFGSAIGPGAAIVERTRSNGSARPCPAGADSTPAQSRTEGGLRTAGGRPRAVRLR